jgi:hypothetical protein
MPEKKYGISQDWPSDLQNTSHQKSTPGKSYVDTMKRPITKKIQPNDLRNM